MTNLAGKDNVMRYTVAALFLVVAMLATGVAGANPLDIDEGAADSGNWFDILDVFGALAEFAIPTVLSIAQLAGLVLAFIGAWKLYQHFTQKGQQQGGTLAVGGAGVVVGPILFFLPNIIGYGGNTIFYSG